MDEKTRTIVIVCVAAVALVIAAFFFKRSFMDSGSVNNSEIQAQVRQATSNGSAGVENAPSQAPSANLPMPGGKGKH